MPSPDLVSLFVRPLETLGLPYMVTGAVAPPEYVILRKLQYLREGGSDKHARDVRAMWAQHGALLDRPTLEAQITRLGLDPVWTALLDGRGD